MRHDAWTTATKAGRKVFYEASTQTIRQAPENYCLLVRMRGHWEPFTDAAAYMTTDAIVRLLNAGWATEPSGEVLADAVEEAFWGSQPLPRGKGDQS